MAWCLPLSFVLLVQGSLFPLLFGCPRESVPLVFFSSSLACVGAVQGSLFPLLSVPSIPVLLLSLSRVFDPFPCIAGLQLLFDLYNTYI